jgi:16S rRNA (cytosine967-C5)-methyltransferase
MKFDNQLRYAVSIIRDYDGAEPLSLWLNNFFRLNRQMGSHDRKTLSSMVYGYYRFGRMTFDSVEKRILAALTTMQSAPEVIDYFGVENVSAEPDNIFPWKELLSDGIDPDRYAKSFLIQPKLFLRVRPGRHATVFEKLTTAGIPYERTDDDCIALGNRTKIEDILTINKDVVVQDKSSQETGGLIRGLSAKVVWDCCAASGGKSIMAFDLLNAPELFVSDVRASILQNCRQRFLEAGIKIYSSFVSDLATNKAAFPEKLPDLIIADVPCTGSGTWGRTPEQLYFFREERIQHYNDLQQRIIDTLLTYNPGRAPILYITCSVFKKENEDMVEYIITHSTFGCDKMNVINGYDSGADTMFAALLTPSPV